DLLAARGLRDGAPRLIVVSCTFYLSFNEIKRVVRKAKKLFPAVPIVIGGAFLNQFFLNDRMADLEAGMRKLGIDYALYAHNSEADLKGLILMLRKPAGFREWRELKNLAYLEKGAFQVTDGEWHEPLVQGVPVHWDKLDLSFVRRTIQLRVSSGCMFQCAFCSYPVTTRGFHPAEPAAFDSDLGRILDQTGAARVIFIDDTFNVPKERFKKICHSLAQRKIAWYSFLRVQFIDDATAALMKASGCAMVYLGIESANDGVLGNMNKKVTRREFEQGLRFLKKYDIPVLAGFVIGFPGETKETAMEIRDFIDSNGVDFYTLKEFYYLPHTPVHQQRERYQLTGSGADWKHQTMTYTEASALKIALFKQITSAVAVDPDTSMWHIAYLNDRGYSMAQVKQVQRAINALIVEQLEGKFREDSPYFAELSRMVKSVP
ncbi:MAG: radical SAM protein, partial [Candidatus Omnitrophica bacterium]|nr:radical SAM protein [Candidatus Omnitrophota bacterium]